MEIRIVRTPTTWSEVAILAKAQFGEMIKAAVDVSRSVMALGGDSMMNVRPSQDNRTRGVENPEIRRKIVEVVEKLVL